MGDLSAVSIPLWVMATVSVVQLLALIGAAVWVYSTYSHLTTVMSALEERQLVPLREKVDAILVDVKAVSARVSQQTERVDQAISGTMDRVDDTAARVRAGVHGKVSQAAGVVRGIRAVIMSLLQKESHA